MEVKLVVTAAINYLRMTFPEGLYYRAFSKLLLGMGFLPSEQIHVVVTCGGTSDSISLLADMPSCTNLIPYQARRNSYAP